MKIEFYLDFSLPWKWAEMCVLGIWALHDNRFLEVATGLFFLNAGIRLDWGKKDA